MTCKRIVRSLPLRINVLFLVIAIVLTVVSNLSHNQVLGIMLLATGWVLTLVALVPSLLGFVREHARKGKGRYADPDIIVPGWSQLRQSMGIERDIKVKVFPNLRNAYADRITMKIKIGQPVLDTLDRVSIKAVAAHELAHIGGHRKEDYSVKQKSLLFGVWVGALLAVILLLIVSYGFDPVLSPFFWFSISLMLADFIGVATRFMLWPHEYQADLIAMQHVDRRAVVSYLTAIARLRKREMTRDSYTHPSVNKRVANLGWSKKTRFKRWHFEM
jgi:Zn-dependent protease with chaperone function